MPYTVKVTSSALEQLQEHVLDRIEHGATPAAARDWLLEVLAVVATLDELPRRRPLAHEDRLRPYEVRWIDHDRYLVLFTMVDETQTVWVLGGRHGRQAPHASLPDEAPTKE